MIVFLLLLFLCFGFALIRLYCAGLFHRGAEIRCTKTTDFFSGVIHDPNKLLVDIFFAAERTKIWRLRNRGKIWRLRNDFR